MVKRSITKYSSLINNGLNALINHEVTQEASIRKYRVNDDKPPREVMVYVRECGELRQWCISRLRILLSRYRWYDVVNLLKSSKARGLNMVVLMALADDEEGLARYISTGAFDKTKVIQVIASELKVSINEAEDIINGGRREHNPLRMLKWNFLPRSI